MNEDQPTSDPEGSDKLLASFAQAFGSSAATLLASPCWVSYVVGPELRIKHFLAQHTAAAEQHDYEAHFAALDPLAPAHCLAAGRWVASLRQLLSRRSAEHQAYLTGFIEPHGIVDALEIFLKSDAGLILGCSLLRHGDAKRFSRRDLAQAAALKTLGDFALSQTFPRRQASLVMISERFPALTAREAMLVQLTAAGLSNKQLCRELDISLPTVKTHLLSIFRKTGVANRTELAAKVLDYRGGG